MGLKDKKSRFPIQGLSSDSFISMAENVTCLILRNSGDRITYANLACEKVLGYKKGDLYSDKFSFWKIFPSKIRKKTKGHYESLKAGEKMDAWECVIADKAGREIPVIISMEVVKSGNKKEYISFITNISHQKDKENEE